MAGGTGALGSRDPLNALVDLYDLLLGLYFMVQKLSISCINSIRHNFYMFLYILLSFSPVCSAQVGGELLKC